MKLVIILCALVVTTHLAWAAETIEPEANQDTTYPYGDVRNCLKTVNTDEPVYRIEVLPGGGFDNLRNLDMGLIHSYNYSNCQVSPDGKYLLPDNVFLIPLQQSKVDLFSEFFEHWDNQSHVTSSSINKEASFAAISGKFSTEYFNTKTHQVNDKCVTTRVQLRHKLYTIKLQPGSQLHPSFTYCLFEIAANLQNNNTDYASYLAELLVRDFGTHYVTSIDTGALISQTDHIKSLYIGEESGSVDKTTLTASAGSSLFAKLFGNSTLYSFSTNTERAAYSNHITHSEISTHGGPPFQPFSFNVSDWENGISNALVAIDRSGEPLHFAINTQTLPHLPDITVQRVSKVVENAIHTYYEANTHTGCTDPNSSNFNFQANVDDNSCHLPPTNFTFGGVYQKCWVTEQHTLNLCTEGSNPAQLKNPLTGGLSCPPQYTAIKLLAGHVSQTTTARECQEDCVLHIFWCKQKCKTVAVLDGANYVTYWCAAIAGSDVSENSGYLFGGFYTTKSSNLLTGTRACPRFFFPLHILNNVEVCVSDDYELGYSNAITFGGFFSCSVGNPLAIPNPTSNDITTWPKSCPHGSNKHLVKVDDCEINFCVQAGSFRSTSLFPARRPPFQMRPDFKANITETLVVVGLYGNVWVKNASGLWDQLDSGSSDGQALIEKLSSRENQSNTLSEGGAIALTFVITLIFGVIIGAMLVCCYQLCRKKCRNYKQV